MSGSSSGSRIKSIFDSDDESDEENSPNFGSTPSTSDRTLTPSSSSHNVGLSVATTKAGQTPDQSAVTPAQVNPSSSSSSRVAASSTAALFARLQKTPPLEIKKASLENKDDCNDQKDESKKEGSFIPNLTKIKTISENKDNSDLNVLNVRKLDERPKGPKKELLDKFIHRNDHKFERDTMQINTGSTFNKESVKITDISLNETNASMVIEQKKEINKFETEEPLHDISPQDAKEKEFKSKEELFNVQVETLGNKEEGEKRGGSPIFTEKAEKTSKHDIKTAIETNTEIPEKLIPSGIISQTGEKPKITIKSSVNTVITGKSEGSLPVICASTPKTEGSPNLILKSAIAPKLVSSREDIPKLILKTSSPGSNHKSIESPKHNINFTESLESTNKVESFPKIILKSSSGSFDKSIESQHTKIRSIGSPDSTKIVESIPKIIVKKSDNSESFGCFGKSPKVTVKNYSLSTKEVSESSKESPNLPVQTEFTSKIISSAGESPQMLSPTTGSLDLTTKKFVKISDSLGVHGATDEIHKLPSKLLHTAETSSVNKTTEGNLKLTIKKSIHATPIEQSNVDKATDEHMKFSVRSPKALDSSILDKAEDRSLTLATKLSYDSESTNVKKSSDGSLKLIIKKPIPASKPPTVDETSDKSLNLSIKSPHSLHSSSIEKAMETGLNLTIKNSTPAIESTSVTAATNESLKLTIKSSQTSEPSSGDKASQSSESLNLITDHKISPKYHDNVNAEVDVKLSPKQKKQDIEKEDKPAFVPCTSNQMEEFKKDSGICKIQKTELLRPVSLKVPPKKSSIARDSIENVSKIEEKAKSNDDNDSEENDNNDNNYFKTNVFKESIETQYKVKTDDKLKKYEDKFSSSKKISNDDQNIVQNVESLVYEEIPKPSYESKPVDFKDLKMSPRLVYDEKDKSKCSSTADHSFKETLGNKNSSPEMTTPRRVGKLLLKIPNYVAKDVRENKPQQLGMDLHKKLKVDNDQSYVQSDKFSDDNAKENYISVADKKESSESESDEDDDIDESKDEIVDTGDDRTSDVNTTLTSNMDPGSSDDDSSSDDSSDSDSEGTANSTLESITDKCDNITEKDNYKEINEEVDMVTNSEKIREDFMNKIEKTSSPMRENVQENEDVNNERNKDSEQNYLKDEETKTCESDAKEEKVEEMDYDYDDLNKDYEQDSDESRMEIVEEEIDEPDQKKTGELKMEEVEVDNKNKPEVTLTKLQDNSRENTTSDIDVETVYRRELDSSSKSEFVKATSTPKNDISLKKVRVEDVFTDTEDEKEDNDCETLKHDSHAKMPAKANDVHEGKTDDNKPLKTSPKTKEELDINVVMKPFLRGWKREVVHRNPTDKSATKTDVYYCSPEDGKKLRSGVEIEAHLLRTGVADLTRHNFTFLRESLGLGENYEVIRYATNTAVTTEVEESDSVEIIEQDRSSLQLATGKKNLNEANSEFVKSRKSRPKPRVEVNIDAVMKAFEKGWQREIVYRSQNQNESGATKRNDIYYYSPEGKKLRSRVEIESHLLRTGVTDLTRDNFTWTREPLGLDEKYEIVRYATPLSASKAMHFQGLTPTKNLSLTPDSNQSPQNPLKRRRALKQKFDPSLQDSTASKRPRTKGEGPPTATFRVKAAEKLMAPKGMNETGIPSLPSSKTSIHQLPGHKNISFKTISKSTPPKKLSAVPTTLNSSSPASMRTYSRGQLSKIQLQQQNVIDNSLHKGNATPSNRNQVVYTSSICSKQPPVPRIITPALGKSERCGSFHCTPLCPRGGGNVPSLSCVRCQCLFHPECCFLPPGTLHLIQSGSTKFLCPNCFSENKANAAAQCDPLSFGCEPLAYDPTDSEDSDEEMPPAGVDTSDYFRVGLIPECPPTPPRSPPPSQEDIQARTAAALESQWIASSHGQESSYNISGNMPMHPNIPGQQGNPQVPGNGQLLQVQSSGATQRFLFIRASGPQATSQGGVRSNMPTKIFLPTGFPGSQTMPIVLPQKNVSSGQSVSIMPTKIMPTKWTQTGPLPKQKPPIRPPFMSTLATDYTIMLRIFSYLHIKDLLVASQVCLMWRDLAANPRLWAHVSLRNICVSSWKLLARFMDRRGTYSMDLRKMRMKAPLQKSFSENERRDSLSPVKDKAKESGQDMNKENSEKDKKIEDSIKIKEEVMDVDESIAETKNDDSNDNMTDESKEKRKTSDVSLSLMEVNDPEEGKTTGNKSNVTGVAETNGNSNEENENADYIKDRIIKTEDTSSISEDKSIKDSGAIEQWQEICHCLHNMERLRSLTLPSCQTEMVHQVLQNCNYLTSLTATDIKADEQNEQTPSFDPSYLMDASELIELRLASSNGFSFTSNFNFIKLQKLKVLVIRGLSETIWPYLGTNLTTLHLGPLRNFTASNWSNIGAMRNLEALWLEDGGNLQDVSVHEALLQLTNLKRLCLFNFIVGPRLHLAVKKMTKLQKVFVLPSKEIDELSTQNGHMLLVAENTKQCSELVWAIWADEVMDKDGKDSIVICPSKIHLKLDGSKRPQEGTEIWSFNKLHSIVSKNLPRSTVRIMKLEPSHAKLMAMNTL